MCSQTADTADNTDNQHCILALYNITLALVINRMHSLVSTVNKLQVH